MATQQTQAANQAQFSLYAGDGQYLKVNQYAYAGQAGRARGALTFATASAKLASIFDRGGAIAACHAARAAGVPVWVVPTPEPLAA